jgi:hypothetical protein
MTVCAIVQLEARGDRVHSSLNQKMPKAMAIKIPTSKDIVLIEQYPLDSHRGARYQLLVAA